MKTIVAFASGLVFAFGLVFGGMTDPQKVQGFLDVSTIVVGRWDASLAFVMAGALLVASLAFFSQRNKRAPLFAADFDLPTATRVDVRLLGGAALFGIGWGLAGYCPGPAIASVLIGGIDVAMFLSAMLIGMVVAKYRSVPRA